MKANVFIEFYGNQIDEKKFISDAKKLWTDMGNKASDLKSMKLYVKPEDNKVYCVFNEDETGSYSIEQAE